MDVCHFSIDRVSGYLEKLMNVGLATWTKTVAIALSGLFVILWSVCWETKLFLKVVACGFTTQVASHINIYCTFCAMLFGIMVFSL